MAVPALDRATRSRILSATPVAQSNRHQPALRPLAKPLSKGAAVNGISDWG